MSIRITSYILVHIFFSNFFFFFEKTRCNEIKNEPAQEQANNMAITLR